MRNFYEYNMYQPREFKIDTQTVFVNGKHGLIWSNIRSLSPQLRITES